MKLILLIELFVDLRINVCVCVFTAWENEHTHLTSNQNEWIPFHINFQGDM